MEAIIKAVEDFNNSSWADVFNASFDEQEMIELAKKTSIEHVLEIIRKKDIALFHREEALNGCI